MDLFYRLVVSLYLKMDGIGCFQLFDDVIISGNLILLIPGRPDSIVIQNVYPTSWTGPVPTTSSSLIGENQ